MKVLIVDDDDRIRTWMCQVLKSQDIDILTASDGIRATALLRAHGIDVVITDILMPASDGIELILGIKREFPGIAVIAITGGGRLNAEFYAGIAGKFGALHTLIKPFKRETLLDTFHACKAMIDAGQINSSTPLKLPQR